MGQSQATSEPVPAAWGSWSLHSKWRPAAATSWGLVTVPWLGVALLGLGRLAIVLTWPVELL
jgi:hypothetical protein